MAMTDWRRRTILFLAFLYIYHESAVFATQTGLLAQGEDTGTPHSPTNAASNVELPFSSTQELSQKLRVGPISGTKFAPRSSMLIPSRVLDEVVLQNNETWNDGTNASDSKQVSLARSNDKSWCIAKSYVTPDAIQNALDWACGPGGADCDPIQLGNACFIPNTIYSHASYAFNSYYQIHQHASDTCDFGGTATITYEDPSYLGCPYPSRSGQAGAPVIAEASRSPMSSVKALIAMSILHAMWVM